MSNIHETIQEKTKEAREACSDDPTSTNCAVAWDEVEELQAEASHQKQAQPEKTSLEKYCDENPDAAECRIYDD